MVPEHEYRPVIDSAMQYAHDVRSGKILANKWVKLAVERHFSDLREGHKRGLWFDEKAAAKAIESFRFLKHTKGGRFAKKPFFLSPYQAFVNWCVFGWKRDDGTRRFQYVYTKVARKGGKSTWMAGNGLYMLYWDGESGAEVYSVATKKDQAKLIFSEAKRMVRAEPLLSKRIKVYKAELLVEDDDSKFEALGADADTLDGSSPHCVFVDEYHAHRNDDVYNVMKSGMGARPNPLLWTITTAGKSQQSPCYALEKECEAILDGLITDDATFCIMYGLDAEDLGVEEVRGPDGNLTKRNIWENEELWVKANPNIGVTPTWNFLRNECRDALKNNRKRTNFLTKNLNVWVDAPETWISAEQWRAGARRIDETELLGRECYAGVDFGSTDDFTALALLFPPRTDAEPFILKVHTFIPEETVDKRIANGLADLETWIEKEYVDATPGNVTDYDYLIGRVMEAKTKYNLKVVRYDPAKATETMLRLQEAGVNVLEYPQGWAFMAPPTAEFERLALGKKINHLNNPVLSWMLSKVVIQRDANDNFRIHKGNSTKLSTGKVDGVVASVIALGGYMKREPEAAPAEQWLF